MKVMSVSGKEGGSVTLPSQFKEALRRDLIKRAFNALRTHKVQRKGLYEESGMRWAVYISKRRKRIKTAYGHGTNRTPRKTMNARGRRYALVAAEANFTPGGRSTHAPHSDKIIYEKINIKERKKALRSALAAAKPYVIEDKLENIKQTKELIKSLTSNGLTIETIKRRNAGKGKMRGRVSRYKKGPLLVFNEKCAALKAAGSIPGVDSCIVKELNVELLAPGAMPGRVTVFSEKAIKTIGEKKLWM